MRRHAEPFHRAQHRDGGRDHAVAVQERGAEESDGDERAVACAAHLRAHERDEREDAALAAVVGAHHEQQILDRHDDDERPEDERQHAEDVGSRHRNRMSSGEAFAERIQRARPDVAVHDAERSKNEKRQA